MKKAPLIKKIVETLRQNIALLEKAARASHAEATHESSRAESKYDTRGLEAAYLAGGQARQVRELMESVDVYQSLETREFKLGDSIDLTALVEMKIDGQCARFFIGPKNGGLEFIHRKKEITILTPQSPLGQTLAGKKAGDKWTVRLGSSTASYRVVSVE
jgi:transcription elongation GreA/GreB family factor